MQGDGTAKIAILHTPATPRYGYELWMRVGHEVEPESQVSRPVEHNQENLLLETELNPLLPHLALQGLVLFLENCDFIEDTTL